jgi:RHS repeat-associated protein
MSRHLRRLSASEVSRGGVRRGIARLLIVTHLATVAPLSAAMSQASQEPGARAGAGAPAPPAAPPTSPRVVVNRTVPRVTAPPRAPSFSPEPGDLEFRRVRIFTEALVPVGRPTRPEENRALAAALIAYVEKGDTEAVSGVLEFLLRFPDSPWRASLMANVGTVFSQTGYYSRALRSWDEAWRLTKAATDVNGRAVADYALGQWFDLVTRLGQENLLAARLDEIKDRSVGGPAAEKVTVAREGLWILTNRHHDAVASASVAVGSLIESLKKSPAVSLKTLTSHHPGENGTSLAAVQRLARSVGFAGRMAYRTRDVEPVAPAILHLQVGHYAALVKVERGLYQVRDAILGDRWITRQALDDEQSGYFLIPEGPLPAGWRQVEDVEAAVVIGHCHPGQADPTDPGPGPCPDGECEPGMPTYNFHPVTTALRLHDAPLPYMSVRGPAVFFSVNYNQRDAGSPQVPVFSHLGPQWEFDWLSYVAESPGGGCSVYGCTAPQVSVSLRGYGAEEYAGAPDYTADFGVHWRSRARLVRTSLDPIRYERRLPDGTVEVFELSDGAPVRQRRVFLTRVIDPQGQQVQLTYDSNLRLVAITDALGQVMTLSYEFAADPLRITKVTDPFGRFATFTYNESGQLVAITDAIGLTSSFAYASGDFITAMTTPYGTTTFRQESAPTPSFRFIEATDPMGGTERVEYHVTHPTLSATAPAGDVPTGFTAYNADLHKFVSVAWSKRAMALHPGDLSKATVTKWLLNRPVQAFLPFAHHASSIPHSIKRPLEGRQWYSYPNQTSTGTAGDGIQPAKVARVMDDGTSQIFETTYNALGRVTSEKDPLGRRTSYVYAANGTDLLEERQTTGGLNELVTQYGNYGADHLPRTITNASGQAATRTYNANGQLLTSTNAKNETTTYTYDSSGFLTTITGPVAGNSASYTYDVYGRIRTATNLDGYTITSDYDALNRPTRTTLPDGTYVEVIYERLDAIGNRDTRGRWTRTIYDALRRPIAMRDPGGRTTTVQWCACGSLDKLIDAKGQVTSWTYDVQGRVIAETRANATQASYAYETTTSRTKSSTDALGQVTTYTYNADDTLQQIAYTNAVIATPSVTYVHDPNYRRVTATASGAGSTTYTYKPAGGLGAGLVASVDGPMANDTVEYDYDELGRVTTRTVNGVASSFTRDALGRLTGETNALGAFTYGYDGVSERLASVSYPNGQSTQYGYSTGAAVKRLLTLHHKRPGGTTLSRFDYTYDATGNVVELEHQSDTGTPLQWQYAYDAVDQLARATQRSTATSAVLKRFGYTYDSAGNRLSEQIDDQVGVATYSNVNELLTFGAGGPLQVAGTVSEPAQVTISGKPAVVAGDSVFRGTVDVGAGTNTFTVAATDSSGNTATKTYEVGIAAASSVRTYDLNGNTLSDGVRSFEWDAESRLVAIVMGTGRTEFTYDAEGRRVRVAERQSGTLTADYRLVWSETNLLEVRESIGGSVTRLFAFGEQQAALSLFYTRDRLGSVIEMLDGSAALRARYTYDPYGRSTKIAGDLDATMGFAGLVTHRPTQLLLASYRQYDPAIGRWLSRDPLGLQGGTANLYAYADNSPATGRDPSGLLTAWEAFQHYRGGTGTPLTMSFSDIDTSRVKPTDFAQVKKYTQGGPGTLCCKDKGRQTIPIDDKLKFQTSGEEALYLGRITLRLTGTLILEGNGKWRFEGQLGAYDDWYDFDTSNRGRLAEWLTGVGAKVKGKPYWIEIRGKKPAYEAGGIECKKKS